MSSLVILCVIFAMACITGVGIGLAIIFYIKRKDADFIGTLFINPDEGQIYFEMDIEFEELSKRPYGRIKIKKWQHAK